MVESCGDVSVVEQHSDGPASLDAVGVRVRRAGMFVWFRVDSRKTSSVIERTCMYVKQSTV